MHQLRRLYVNYAVIHYSSLSLYPTDYIATSRYFYLITPTAFYSVSLAFHLFSSSLLCASHTA
ncbi:hypothetical protein PEC301645_39040 [Pectobacterium carotovorum subsp. carotovorum]|nr:hypothetical protein PEC301645_39040 [Pectobacterium carotovorum subsp. carotovorum]